VQVFITGGTGFVGSYLVEALLSAGHHVFALVHDESSHQALPVGPRVQGVRGDLRDPRALEEAISACRPELIYHLAGQASPGRSWSSPAETIAINTGGTANLLQAALKSGRPRVVVVTSAQIYSHVKPEDLPVTEDTVPNPEHPYGVSKWAAGQLCRLYWRHHQLPVIEVRPFNHVGPRQTRGFVVPDFASQVAAIALDLTPPIIEVGNLLPERDFTDVRDIVRAYLLLAEHGRPGETYLACSGQPVPIGYLLDTLIELAGVQVEVRQDPSRVRPAETRQLYGSFDRLERDTGWSPQIPLRHSLAETLAEWQARLAP
jgi:GDP-4-dehydro-6-deoxy-D-mannose reductase